LEITSYGFGKIEIDGQTYSTDVIVTVGKVYDSWRRKDGHRLQIPDLETILEARPDLLVVGTGYFGRMKVPDETKSFLQSKGIEVFMAPSSRAVKELTKLLQEGVNVVGAFHLTC
jgi:hypothetical protein